MLQTGDHFKHAVTVIRVSPVEAPQKPLVAGDVGVQACEVPNLIPIGFGERLGDRSLYGDDQGAIPRGVMEQILIHTKILFTMPAVLWVH
ncbi:hypothetical protein D3C87_1643750 [compost metagenome]